VFKVSFDNLFQICQKGWVTSKVAKNHHNQIVLLIEYKHTSVRIDIKLKFRGIEHVNGIALVASIRLGALFDMISPVVCNGLRFDDPVIFWRIRGFQLGKMDCLYLEKK
jgi:hypothetical protein